MLPIFFTMISFAAYAQQHSSIHIDSGKNNDISVTQSGGDSIQRSDITLKKSDSNTLQLQQKITARQNNRQVAGFNEWIKNTKNVFALLISIATLIGLLWKGYPYAKKIIAKK